MSELDDILHFWQKLKSPSEGNQSRNLLSVSLSLFFIVPSLVRLFVSMVEEKETFCWVQNISEVEIKLLDFIHSFIFVSPPRKVQALI